VTAVSRPVAPPGTATGPAAGSDLLAAWRPGGFLMERGGAGVMAAGELHRLEIASGPGQVRRAAGLAEAALSAAGTDLAVVTGALPFRGDARAELVIPERVIVTSMAPRDLDLGAAGASRPSGDARGSLARLGSGPPEAPIRPSHGGERFGGHPNARSGSLPRGPHQPPSPLRWRAEPSAAGYAQMVAEAIGRIRAGELEKVVLTRSLVATNPGLDLAVLLAELRRRDPDCHLFAAPAAGGGAFVGATPETLVRREGARVLSVPLAGTAPRSSDPDEDRRLGDALLGSAKDRHEHAAVVEAIADALAPHCSELRVDPQPCLAATATVWHLATAVRGRLRREAPSALALAAALHPTPAVCGTPTAAAEALIGRLEGSPRGLYAGLVGWMDGRGDGEWAVSLRCALITAGEVRIHAGAGIVDASEPDLEVAETEVKFRTMIDALEAATGPAARARG